MASNDGAELALRNTLIQYKGGGYDGCYWEWNLALIDAEGNYVDIHSTGRKGAATLAEFEERQQPIEYLNDLWKMQRDEVPLGKLAAAMVEPRDGIYLYDLTQQTDMRAFGDACIIGLPYGTAKWMRDKAHLPGALDWFFPEVKCHDCGGWFDADDLIPALPEHQGGIVISMTVGYCEECHSIHQCSWCGEVYEDIEAAQFAYPEQGQRCAGCRQEQCTTCKAWADSFTFDEEGRCPDCIEQWFAVCPEHGAQASAPAAHSEVEGPDCTPSIRQLLCAVCGKPTEAKRFEEIWQPPTPPADQQALDMDLPERRPWLFRVHSGDEGTTVEVPAYSIEQARGLGMKQFNLQTEDVLTVWPPAEEPFASVVAAKR